MAGMDDRAAEKFSAIRWRIGRPEGCVPTYFLDFFFAAIACLPSARTVTASGISFPASRRASSAWHWSSVQKASRSLRFTVAQDAVHVVIPQLAVPRPE